MVIFNELFQTLRLSKWYLHFDTPSRERFMNLCALCLAGQQFAHVHSTSSVVQGSPSFRRAAFPTSRHSTAYYSDRMKSSQSLGVPFLLNAFSKSRRRVADTDSRLCAVRPAMTLG